MLQMADYSTPAHPPIQAIHPPVQPAAVPFYHLQAPAQYSYGYYQHPAPYGYHVVQPGEGQPPAPSSKRPLEEPGEGPTPTKFGGGGRGRGMAKEPGHLWGWQRIGFFEDRPSCLPSLPCPPLPGVYRLFHIHDEQEELAAFYNFDFIFL